MVSRVSVFMSFFPDHFLWSTNNGNGVTELNQEVPDFREHLGVCDVLTVPRQQVFYPVERRNGNVECVDQGIGRENTAVHNLPSKLRDVRWKFQKWNLSECLLPLCGQYWISKSRFIEHVLGSNQFVIVAFLLPPAPGKQLAPAATICALGRCRR